MTTELTKAAQQALEVLESLQGGCTDHDDGTVEAITVWCPEVIEALRNALTQRPAAQTERVALRGVQADAVMPLIGPLLDAWENADREVMSQEPELSKQLKAIDRAMEDASLPAPQQATPEPVVHKCRHCGVTTIEDEDGVTMQGLPAPERPVMFDPSADVPIPATPEPLIVKGAMAGMVDAQVRDLWPTKGATPEPVGEPNEMESAWCWWVGDGKRFHIVDTESEAHGEAQCHIDDDCDPGQTHEYSVARVQHPLDALGMDWLALHVAESIAENVCCWCDDNTGAEEPSIMLSPDDSKALGVMVATFLHQRVGVKWWTADQKTVTVHTYASGSNDNPALAAAQAKGGA